jgi:hypothetical protein
MGVVEPGNHAAVERVKNSSRGTNEGGDVLVVTDRDKDTVTNGRCRRGRSCGIPGEDSRVAHNDVRGNFYAIRRGAYATDRHGTHLHSSLRNDAILTPSKGVLLLASAHCKARAAVGHAYAVRGIK